mgnify:CR=1 FL=1
MPLAGFSMLIAKPAFLVVLDFAAFAVLVAAVAVFWCFVGICSPLRLFGASARLWLAVVFLNKAAVV